MSTPSSASPTGTRPYNGLLLATFGFLSVVGAWYMRIYPMLKGAPLNFRETVEGGTHPNGTPIENNFTGLGFLDQGLAFLVTAFLPGSAGWNEAYYWQQFHFLPQLTPFIAIMTVEACRERNQGSWLTYTSLFALFYQNIGGALVAPIWALLLHRLSGRNTYFQSGRTVPLHYARLILPAMILIYFIPTIAMFIPGQPIDLLQTIIAFWQLTPIFVNIPLWVVSPYVSSKPATGKAKTADMPHLTLLYNVLLALSIITHWISIYKIASSENPDVSFVRVFLPSTTHWLTSMDEGLLWIFQSDWIIIGLVCVIPALVAIYDIQRMIPDYDEDPAGDKIFKGVYMTAALTVLGGPGAAFVGIWGWREEQMAVLEERAEKRSAKKGI